MVEHACHFDLLTALATHGNGELLDHVTSFCADFRKTSTVLCWGYPSQRDRHYHMSVASAREKDCENGDSPQNAHRNSVVFEGIACGGMLHLTSPLQCNVIDLKDGDTLPCSAFPQLSGDGYSTQSMRHLAMYSEMMQDGLVFLKKEDTSLHISLGESFFNSVVIQREHSYLAPSMMHHEPSSDDVRQTLHSVIMPVDGGRLHKDRAEDTTITFARLAHAVVLRHRASTYGRVPLSFRLDSMSLSVNMDILSRNCWALLVPLQWLCDLQYTKNNGTRKIKISFDMAASAVVDGLMVNNMSDIGRSRNATLTTACAGGTCCSLYHTTNAKYTLEGKRLRVTSMIRKSRESEIFKDMIKY